MQGILGIQREADRQAMERDAMNMRGGMLRQEPGLMQRVGSQARRLFYGDRNLYGNDPLQPSVMDSQYVRPEMAEGAVLDVVGGPMATVWHGSPHLFKKFDMSKIGTGEGAQAYGHGLYFAENPAVAQEYRNALAQPEFGKTADGVALRGRLPDMLRESYESLLKQSYGPVNPVDAVDSVSTSLKRQRADALKVKDMDWFNQVADMESDLHRFSKSPAKSVGYEYKVDIPDDQIAKMLDWDKPLKDQPQSVKDFVKQRKQLPNLKKSYKDFGGAKMTGHEIHQWLKSGSGVGLDNPKSYGVAENQLLGGGIPGIKYLDQGSRGAGKGTSNFVVFDDQIPQILEINDKPVRGVLSGQ